MGQLLLGATSLIAKICKAPFLRIAVFGPARSKSDSRCKAVNVCFHLSEQVISQVPRMHTFRPVSGMLRWRDFGPRDMFTLLVPGSRRKGGIGKVFCRGLHGMIAPLPLALKDCETMLRRFETGCGSRI